MQNQFNPPFPSGKKGGGCLDIAESGLFRLSYRPSDKPNHAIFLDTRSDPKVWVRLLPSNHMNKTIYEWIHYCNEMNMYIKSNKG